MHRTRFSRRSIAGVIAVVVLSIAAVGVAVVAHPAAAVVGDCTTGSDWGTSRTDLASSVVDLVNSHRTGMGLVSLKVSPTLTNAAVWKARHMARYAYMQHDDPAPPVARTPGDRLEACGYPSRTTGWGENIAYGYASAASVVDAWLNSPGHKANIENSSYRSTGVGAAANASGVVYWSQEFGTYADSGSGGGGGGTSAPTVSLTNGPASSTTATTASFGWSSTGTIATTTCSLDNATAVACTSPTAYSGLAVGSHSFRVTVTNSAGSASAAYSWAVTSAPPPPPPPPTSTAPRVSLTSGAGRYSYASTATFTWVASGNVTSTTCTLDLATAVPCSSPWQVSGLQRGSHRFVVTVKGPGGTGTASTSWYVLR